VLDVAAPTAVVVHTCSFTIICSPIDAYLRIIDILAEGLFVVAAISETKSTEYVFPAVRPVSVVIVVTVPFTDVAEIPDGEVH
jgi:hypothetical protein